MNDSSDRPLLDLIRRQGPLTVAEMGELLHVTPTAVRNRLTRLVGSGMVERRSESGGRGRPRPPPPGAPAWWAGGWSSVGRSRGAGAAPATPTGPAPRPTSGSARTT